VHVEPHKKQLHVTLAYHFQTSHLPTLEKLAQNIDVKLGCDWVAAIFSRDIRFVNHEVRAVEFVSVQKEMFIFMSYILPLLTGFYRRSV